MVPEDFLALALVAATAREEPGAAPLSGRLERVALGAARLALEDERRVVEGQEQALPDADSAYSRLAYWSEWVCAEEVSRALWVPSDTSSAVVVTQDEQH